jgi:hypothetical protein
MIQGLLYRIRDLLLEYLSRYTFFIRGDYYAGLFHKYFSLLGFFVGIALVLLLYFSSADDLERTKGFFLVLPIVAVINSCSVLVPFLSNLLHIWNDMSIYYPPFTAADNIISGFILTLVVISCYKLNQLGAFLLGVTVFAVEPLLYFSNIEAMRSMDGSLLIFLLIRIVLAGFVCLIISCRKQFFTGWIWYMVFHMLLRAGTHFIYIVRYHSGSVNATVLKEFLFSLRYYVLDYLIFFFILAFAIVFERAVLRAKMPASAP